MEQSKSSDISVNNFNYSGFWRRFAASIIDGLILSLIGIGISYSLGTNPFAEEAKTNLETIDRVLTLIVSVVYVLLFWVNYDGATPGKRFLGIKIIKENGEKLNYPSAFIRYVGYWISSLPLFLGYFWMLWDKKKQAWHDKLAGTIVVKTDKKVNNFIVAIVTMLALFSAIGINAFPPIYKEIKKASYQKERQEEFVEDTKKYIEDVNKLDTQTQDLLKSALAKVQKANELAKEPNITASEKEQIQTLLASSIKEAKQVADSNPQSPVAWLQLGNIYSFLIDVADGADTWSISSYQKAISLEPNNYLYHEKLGGVFFRVKKIEQAIAEFTKVTELSPSYANGYYNLGVAYKEYGAKSRAKEALNKALELLPTNDPDRFKVEKELETL